MISNEAPVCVEISAAQARTQAGLPPVTDPLLGDMQEIMRLRLQIAELTAKLAILNNGHEQLP